MIPTKLREYIADLDKSQGERIDRLLVLQYLRTILREAEAMPDPNCSARQVQEASARKTSLKVHTSQTRWLSWLLMGDVDYELASALAGLPQEKLDRMEHQVSPLEEIRAKGDDVGTTGSLKSGSEFRKS